MEVSSKSMQQFLIKDNSIHGLDMEFIDKKDCFKSFLFGWKDFWFLFKGATETAFSVYYFFSNAKTYVWQAKHNAKIGMHLKTPSAFQKTTLDIQMPDHKFGNAAMMTLEII